MRDAGCAEAAMEVSSHAIDLGRVVGTRFAVVAFSNLTQDHLDYHKTMERYFEAKAALFSPEYSGKAAICVDDPYGERLAGIARARGLSVLTVGRAQGADLHVEQERFFATHTDMGFSLGGRGYEMDYPLIGGFNVSNVALAIGICVQLGYPVDEVVAALREAPQVPGRLERVAPEGRTAREVYEQLGISVFVDYAHTPDSIEKAIGALRPITERHLIIVFGCGGDRDRTKRPKMGAAACAADHAIVTSDNPRTEDPDAIIADILPGMAAGEGRYEVEPDRRRAIFAAVSAARRGDTVLIAGKGHEDYQLVGDKVLDFDDRVVAAEALAAVFEGEGE